METYRVHPCERMEMFRLLWQALASSALNDRHGLRGFFFLFSLRWCRDDERSVMQGLLLTSHQSMPHTYWLSYIGLGVTSLVKCEWAMAARWQNSLEFWRANIPQRSSAFVIFSMILKWARDHMNYRWIKTCALIRYTILISFSHL